MPAPLPSHLPTRRSPGKHILPGRCPALRLQAQCSLICLALCVWLAGCGSSHTSASHSTGTTTAAASTPPSAAYDGLEPFLIQGNEETGYAVQRPLEHYKTAAGYAASEQDPADAQRLSRAGFQQALVENTGGGNGISYVLQFATVSDAARDNPSSSYPTPLVKVACHSASPCPAYPPPMASARGQSRGRATRMLYSEKAGACCSWETCPPHTPSSTRQRLSPASRRSMRGRPRTTARAQAKRAEPHFLFPRALPASRSAT